MVERVVAHTPDETCEALARLNWSVVALDTETTDLSYTKLEPLGFSVFDGNTAVYVNMRLSPRTHAAVLNDFISRTKTIVMHNAVFDAKVMNKMGVDIDKAEWFDTMVASHLIDENRSDKRLGGKGHGLKVLAAELLGEEVVDYKEALQHGVNSEKFYEYAQNDVIFTWELAHIFRPQLEEQGMVPLFREIEMPFLRALANMEMAGIRVDLQRVDGTTRQIREKLFQLETKMLDLLGIKYELQMSLTDGMTVVSDMNFNSARQLMLVFDKLGLEVTQKTKTGAPSIGKTTLMQMKGKHSFIDLLEQYKAAQKLLTAFFEPLPELVDSDGRIRPHFHNTGTVTGRLSCSNPNLQQLPKENKRLGISTRSAFVPTIGKKIVAVDYSQQELRIMAELSRDERLVKVIEDKGDLHLINANLVFNLGIPEEKLFATHPEFDRIKEEYKKDRDKGKVFSFGIPYGMGPHKLSRDFNVSVTEAETLLANFFNGFPDLKRSIEATHTKVKQDLYVTTLTGRRRHFVKNEQGWLDSKSLRQSFNFLIQSFGADLIRMSCVKIYDYAKKHPEHGVQLLMTVHDEVVLECNAESVATVALDVENLMESCANIIVPLKADASWGDSYGEAK